MCHDKGTYDAINLCPEDPLDKREKYLCNVHKLLCDGGLFIVTSVNWTQEELSYHLDKCMFKVFQLFYFR